MRSYTKIALASALLLFGAAACADLEVQNLNAPDAERALESAGDVESLIAGTFETWHDGQFALGSDPDYGVGLWLSNASFQHTAPWANFAMEFYARIPRNPIVNDPAHVEYGYFASAWYDNYSALSALADGLTALEGEAITTELGEDATLRAKAFARFVQGMAHGSIAVLYDKGFIVDETTDLTQPQDPVDYMAMMEAAMGYFDEAIALAGQGFAEPIPAGWMSVTVSADKLVELAYAHKARFRANVARNPEERAAVNWTQVISDANNGITETWVMDMDPFAGWYNAVIDYGTYPGWAENPYFIMGMADQAGNYQRWLDQPLAEKDPNPAGGAIVIVSDDERFPRGATVDEQMDNPGSLYVIPTAFGIANVWKRPDRGTWRWSWYWHVESEMYTYWLDFSWPLLDVAEMDLLRAEGHYRNGQLQDAVDIVNQYRTAAGLSETDINGTNTSCVPRLPDGGDGTCGDLWEMLKWEKRMETRFKGLYANSWYFDGRGWQDLWLGTPLQLPVPCLELQTLQMLPCYTFGGVGGESASPGSIYQWPSEGD